MSPSDAHVANTHPTVSYQGPSLRAQQFALWLPERLAAGKYVVGYTRWLSPQVRRSPLEDGNGHRKGWSAESVVEFMQFDNLDEARAPDDLHVSYHAWAEKALRVPHYCAPLISLHQLSVKICPAVRNTSRPR